MKFIAVMAGSVALQNYLGDKQTPPTNLKKAYRYIRRKINAVASKSIIIGVAVVNAAAFTGAILLNICPATTERLR